jgi:hypothetical protein
VTPREAARLRAAIAVLRAKRARESSQGFIPHKPYPKQAEFLALTCLEAFYGGAVGGGKSDALLMGALEHVHVPGYAALLLRRTYADLALPGAIMERSATWLHGTGATWNGTDKRWTFPSGATLTFGYLDTEKDKYRYASAEFQYIGFDEVTQFPEGWYRFLLSRLRRTAGLPVPLRARSAGNPGGIGHAWVKRRFVDSTGPECRFVPANLADNPALDAVEYRKSLAQLEANTRRQLEEGIWVQDVGGLVYQYDDQRNGIDACPQLDFQILSMDYGVTNATSFNRIGWRANDPCVYVAESYKQTGLIPSVAAQEAKDLEATHHFVAMVGDLGGLGKAFGEEATARFNVPIEAAEKNNKRGYIELFNGELERGLVKVVRSKCQPLITEWSELPWTEDRLKEAAGFDNHCADGTLYGWRKACAYGERAKPTPLEGEAALRAEEAAIVQKLEEEVQRESSMEWWEQ